MSTTLAQPDVRTVASRSTANRGALRPRRDHPEAARAPATTSRTCAGTRGLGRTARAAVHREARDGRTVAACTTRGPPPGGDAHDPTLERARKRCCCRCCSSRATTSAPAARRAATAGCRPGLRARHHRPALRGVLSRPPGRRQPPRVLLDFNRCILCKLCVRASARSTARRVRDRRPRHRHPWSSTAQRPARRQRARTPTTWRAHLPGGRDPAQAARLRGADRPDARAASSRGPEGDAAGRRRRGRAAARASCAWPPCRWPAASAATCRCSTSTSGCSTLFEKVEFDRSPLTDIKTLGRCDIGLVEGGLCNAENVHVLREFRARCKVLVAVGACAITGGLPAQRNALDVGRMLIDVYRTAPGWRPAAAGAERPRAAAAAEPRAPDPRGGAHRPLPARLPAQRRRHLAALDLLAGARRPGPA
jgi:hypothetical protein